MVVIGSSQESIQDFRKLTYFSSYRKIQLEGKGCLDLTLLFTQSL